MISMDITTEGPQKTANSKRAQCCLILAEHLQSESGHGVNAQLDQLLQSPVAQYVNPTAWSCLCASGLQHLEDSTDRLYHPG